ncbi:MAG: glycosyltransferase family 4 protein [Pseudomonadota bacterium]|nr:glycosyltransferase family 4 protein [Pseudomonadota bacterium]
MPTKIAVLAAVPPSGEQGGAERFSEGLQNALRDEGAEADILSVVSDERDYYQIQESYLRFYDLDLSAYDGVISTKAPAYLVRHPNHVCYLQHTMRAFYDLFERQFPKPSKALLSQRRFIRQLDTAALRPPRTRRRFTISHEVTQRLEKYNGLDSDVLYQASTLCGFRRGAYQYVFLPGRLHRWKRVDLVIKAMRYVRAKVKLIIVGTGEDELALRSLAVKDPRISFLGRISDEELLDLYANALVVPFVPLQEDFGLVTLEAFHSEKPVLTCVDSGEPARIVEHGHTGFVCAPAPKSIAKRIDQLAADPDAAARMGRAGAKSIQHINWKKVAVTLLEALNTDAPAG